MKAYKCSSFRNDYYFNYFEFVKKFEIKTMKKGLYIFQKNLLVLTVCDRCNAEYTVSKIKKRISFLKSVFIVFIQLYKNFLFPAQFIFKFFLLFSCFKTIFFIEHEFDITELFLKFFQSHVRFHVQIHVFCNHVYASNFN